MFRSTDYDYDGDAGVSSMPATASQYTGSGFEQQSITGVRHMDDESDRVTFEASIDSPTPQGFSIGLGGDLPSTGYAAVYGGSIFGGIEYGEPTSVDPGRPALGFPLPRETDEQYASRTNDYTIGTTHDEIMPIVMPGVQYIPEKPMPVLQRLSEHPAEIQPVRPWDTVVGSWPWTGDKVALQRPVAAAPLTFSSPLLDAIPSPTGTSGSDVTVNRFSAEPTPMTFRLPPEPWDTNNDGQYVDNGM